MLDLSRLNPFKGHFLWSALVLILANLSCLLGIVFFDWTAMDILWLYWMETFIVGIFNILKMLSAAKKAMLGFFGNLFFAAFFTVHYNAFVIVQGIFIFMFSQGVMGDDSGYSTDYSSSSDSLTTDSTATALTDSTTSILTDSTAQVQLLNEGIELADLPSLPLLFLNTVIDKQTVYWGIVAIFLSHLFSFIYHYLIRGEFRRTSPQDLMIAPYKRIFIQQFVVIGGAFLLMGSGIPSPFLFLLIGLKIAVDLMGHVREHSRLAQ